MSVPRVAQYAPFLRRYARALTGSQSEGDGFVQTALESLLAKRINLREDLSPKAALFRAFHEVWLSSVNGAVSRAGGELGADERLQHVAPVRRAALLLTLMEGFQASDAAAVLGVPSGDVERLVSSALSDIDQDMETEVLIIEDEPIIALDLERLVGDLGHRVAGVATTRTEAADLISRVTPGLVLADVQLADGSSGIDTASDILRDLDVPIIFITAFPERLLTGERPEPTYLVSKPYEDEAVKAVIGQALFFHGPARRRQSA